MNHPKKLTLFMAVLLLLAGWIVFQPQESDAGTVGPDVTVHELQSTQNYGVSNGMRAYSVGTTSCNIGDEPLWWCDDPRSYCEDTQHPVIAQNIYRLKNGRFEQLGMSWLKHGFLSVNSSDSQCGDGSCEQPPHGGDQLGIGCTDPYGAGLNGSRPLGMRSEVNATTGLFPMPYTEVPSPQFIDQRIQVVQDEIDPNLNPGARFYIEGHYVAEDDAAAGHALNNASYREVNIQSNFDLQFAGPTVRKVPAIFAWKAADPDVEMLNVDIGSPTQRFHVARKVTKSLLGDGWHYEYAIHNMNSDRSARSFGVHFSEDASISLTGFRDVDHHSGEPYATQDWDPTVEADSVVWSTDTVDIDENANALRWGTMFNFWFDSDLPPSALTHSLGLFKDGIPGTIEFNWEVGLIFFDGFESGDVTVWFEIGED